jgi:outer membrane protein, heavy metal efflux system
LIDLQIYKIFIRKNPAIALFAAAMVFGPPMLCAQTTPEDAVRAALLNHPLAKASAFDVQAKKYSEKSALNLPNPEINAESPTGEFYAVGILQSFEFPTVYARQKQVARAETALAQAGQRVGENELRYRARALYLAVQVAEHQSRQWAQRDSFYHAIAAAAGRQFAAGEIDFLQKTLAENEAGKVRQERLSAERSVVALRSQMVAFTGLDELGAFLPLRADTAALVSMPGTADNPAVAFEQQATQVAEKQIGLAQSRALPNFSFGYLNQGARNTPLDYRFRATVGIPLWAGQYRAGKQAAQSAAEAAQSRAAAQMQAVELELESVQTEARAALEQVRYHEREALPRSLALIATATRLREAGQLDYVAFLRTLDEAFDIPRAYAAQIRVLNEAVLKLRYLAGQ